MKNVKAERPVFQGDLMILRVATLPEGVVKEKSNIVAHSETGHHHVAERAQVWAVPGNPMIRYLTALDNADAIDIVHLRDWDTHETLRLDSDAVYEVRRQREWAPEGWRQVAD